MIHFREEEELAIVIGDLFLPISLINAEFLQQWESSLESLLNSGRFDNFKSWFDENQEDLFKLSNERKFELSQYKIYPLLRKPSKIWGIGLNYVDHATDLDEDAPKSIPASFMKAHTTIIGHRDEICIPTLSERTTGEAELGIILKKKCHNVKPEKWLSVVAGFTTILDMTAEDILRKNPRYLTVSKNFDTFFSLGPILITPDEIPDISKLNVATVINGKIHAQNKVANMTFSPSFLVSFHSRVMTFLPGDIISTGTPRAVILKHHDILECQIDGFPSLINPVIDSKESEL